MNSQWRRIRPNSGARVGRQRRGPCGRGVPASGRPCWPSPVPSGPWPRSSLTVVTLSPSYRSAMSPPHQPDTAAYCSITARGEGHEERTAAAPEHACGIPFCQARCALIPRAPPYRRPAQDRTTSEPAWSSSDLCRAKVPYLAMTLRRIESAKHRPFARIVLMLATQVPGPRLTRGQPGGVWRARRGGMNRKRSREPAGDAPSSGLVPAQLRQAGRPAPAAATRMR